MPGPRTVSESDIAIRDGINKLNDVRDTFMRLGLYRTGHQLHEAIRTVGYEYADILTGQQERMLAGGARAKIIDK